VAADLLHLLPVWIASFTAARKRRSRRSARVSTRCSRKVRPGCTNSFGKPSDLMRVAARTTIVLDRLTASAERVAAGTEGQSPSGRVVF
jgi:hypothetical protein